ERRVALLAREPLLLRRGDDRAVSEQAGGAVVVKRRDAQDVLGGHQSDHTSGKPRATIASSGGALYVIVGMTLEWRSCAPRVARCCECATAAVGRRPRRTSRAGGHVR